MQKEEGKIRVWLLMCAIAIFIMVGIGGATRLTGSGLSMVNWKPISGWLPPLSGEQWQQEFEHYKTSPQFKKVNNLMNLEGFKKIFFLEYIHRLWGRLIGVLFFFPFLYFSLKKYLSKKNFFKYLFFLILGGLQGFLGWYMVKSGLVDIPRVSPYRLTGHLALALLCYSLIVWELFGLYSLKKNDKKTPAYMLFFTLILIVQIIYGGFMAGLEAGRGYNTFPLMNGEFIPSNLGILKPTWLNFFENNIAVQFIHRLGGWLLLFLGIIYLFSSWQKKRNIILPIAVVGCVSIQFALGVFTLLSFQYGKPVVLAVVHQLVAIILLTLSLAINYKNS